MEVHFDVFPAPREVEARAGVVVEFEIRHAVSEFGGFFGILLDFVERVLILDTVVKLFAEADLMTDFDPVILAEAVHLREGGFAEVFEEIVPDAGDSEIVIIPEFTLRFGAISGDGRVAGVDRIGFAKFVEEVRETYFDEDVVFFDVFLEFVFVLDDGVFEGNTVRADEIRVNNEVVFGIHVANGHLFIPNFVGVG